MKLVKRILYGIIAVLMASCVGILICALNPSLTGMLAGRVQQLQAASEKPDGIEVPEYGQADDVGRYEAPEELPQNLPDGVAGLAGYRPVTSENLQISQEEADNLGSILAPGETGEGISFPEEFYPYYGMLDNTLRRVYCQVYANAMNLNTSFTPIVVLTVDQAKIVVEAVYSDHPELFWLEAEFSCKYLKTGICVELTLEYNETVNDLETAKRKFTECAEEILVGARGLQSDYEKEKYIHDALVQIVDYDMSARMNQSAYSALVFGKTVCAGYAKAFQYLLQQVGIPCYYCTGYAGEDHAWNIVKLGGKYRNVDVTWDDTDPSTYDYYNQSDRAFAPTHARTDLAVYLPSCGESVPDDTASGGSAGSVADAYINPNPIEPMQWHSREEEKEPEPSQEEDEEARRLENLMKAGITQEDVLETLEEYYEDCGKRLKDVGTGDKQFTNVIPETLWDAIERAYSSGDYWKGYVNDALEELKADNFVIQLQVQRLGGGYCRLYHNIYVY